MANSYTEKGVKKVGIIIQNARKALNLSFREFESKTGIDHSVLRRLELGELSSPDFSHFACIAPFTHYTVWELQAIAAEVEAPGTGSKFPNAESVMPIVRNLPLVEVFRLGQMIFDYFHSIEVADRWEQRIKGDSVNGDSLVVLQSVDRHPVSD